MLRSLIVAAALLWACTASAAPSCLANASAAPFKTRPWTFVDWTNTLNARAIWGYCKNADPTKRPTAWAIVAKKAVANSAAFANAIDQARILSASPADFSNRLSALWDATFTAASPVCYRADATGAWITKPYTLDAGGHIVDYTDADFTSACTEVLPLILSDWPDASVVTPPPPPPPPPPPSFVVSPNPLGGTTVSVYSVVGGRRGPLVAGVRATVGSPCNPSTTIVEASVTYMAVTGGVAKCQASSPSP